MVRFFLNPTTQTEFTYLVSDLFSRPIKSPYLKKKILFHDDNQYTGVCKYWTVGLKIDYTLRCLEYICSISAPLRRQGYIAALAPIDLLIVKTLTNVLLHTCIFTIY